MSNTLMRFQENFESWQVTHPRRWVATTDRADAVHFLSNQTKKVVKAQFEAADAIIVSQDRIADKIDDLIQTTENVAIALDEIQATFEWGFTELIWQIEQEREVLKDILKVLQAPLDTQAKELKKRAEYAYRSGWFDDALTDFLESEKINRYDFTIHENLGNIYLFEKKDPDKALEYYEKAVKYATPKSSYYASMSLLHVGLVKYLHEDFRGAYEATLKAIELSPGLYEAHYQHAQYCVNLGRYDEAIKHLKKAIIDGDKYYCVKADSEKDFNVMKKQLRSLHESLQGEACCRAGPMIQKAEELIQHVESLDIDTSRVCKWSIARLKEAKEFFRRKSYFDYLDAELKAREAEKVAIDETIKYLERKTCETKNEIQNIEDKTSKLKEKVDKEWGIFALILGFCYLFITILLTGLSSLSAGAKAKLIFLFIISSFGAGPIIAYIIARMRRSNSITPLTHEKKQFQNVLSKVENKMEQLWNEEKKISRDFAPNDAEAHYNLGVVYHLKGMYDKAIAEHKKALEINPNLADAHYNLGLAYSKKKGMSDEAFAEWKKAVEINPKDADAHYNLGLAYSKKKGMLDEAIAEWKKAVEINPKDADAHRNLEWVYDKKGMSDEAIAEWKKAVEINPDLKEM